MELPFSGVWAPPPQSVHPKLASVMEETKPRPGKPGDRAQIAAEKLRALRERANQALDEHRSRLAQIESELNLRVRQLADEFEATSAKLQGQSTGGRDEEVAALRAQLEEGRAKHEKFVEQLALARRQLDAIQAQPCAACQDAANQLADAQGEMRALREKLETADRQREEDRLRHEKFTEQVAAARAAIAELQSKSGDQTAQLLSDLETARIAKAAADEQVGALTRDIELLHAECEAAQNRMGELEAERAADFETHRRDADAELSEHRQRITSLEADLSVAEQACADLKRQSEADKQSIASLQQHLSETQCAREDAAAALASQQTELGQRQSEWDATRSGLESEVAKLQSELGALHAELAEARAEAADQLQSLSEQLVAAQAALPKLTDRVAALEAENESLGSQLAEQRALAESQRSEFQAQIANLESEKTSLSRDLARARDECRTHQQAAEAAQKQLRSVGESEAAIVELQQQLTVAKTDLAEGDRLLEELQGALDSLDAELNELRDSTCPKAELESLQQKFDLALADVQRLKQDNGALQEELAVRPAACEGEPPELVAMRVERDELESRVNELEAALAAAQAAAADGAPSQEATDLQRRFEMAVDDVRQLKHENADLREQLAKSKSTPTSSGGAHAGSNDWASQRARLMAMLEEEDGDGGISAERKKERASIQDAIAATDRAMAAKDRELAELRARANSTVDSAKAEESQKIEEILNAEPLVAAERERLAKLQAEWEDKLRAAELEFSVERAKLAREQAALRERLLEIQKQEPRHPTGDGDKHPRRRWLSALGLGDEQEEPKPKPR